MPAIKHNSTWFKKCKTEREKKELRADIANARYVLNTLHAILEGYIASSQSRQSDENNYEKPSWAYLQADKIGEIRAFNKVISLIEEKSLTNKT